MYVIKNSEYVKTILTNNFHTSNKTERNRFEPATYVTMHIAAEQMSSGICRKYEAPVLLETIESCKSTVIKTRLQMVNISENKTMLFYVVLIWS